jgi:phosphomevalonate kinase
MTKNEIDPNSKNIEEKLMLVQSMKEEAKEKILFNEELIENIFNVFSTIGEPELFRLLITIYNKHGYYSEKDFSTVPTQYPR